MDMQAWVSSWRSSWQARGQVRARRKLAGLTSGADEGLADLTTGLGRGLTGRSMALAEVQEEVAAEARGQVAILGRCDMTNLALLARLREETALASGGPVYREGFFTVVTLPQDPSTGAWPPDVSATSDAWGGVAGMEWWLNELEGCDALLYVVDGSTGPGEAAADARWCARLRGLGRPILTVCWTDGSDAIADELGRWLHLPPSARPLVLNVQGGASGEVGGDAGVLALATRLLELRPRLAIPLAQEAPSCREYVARRVIRQNVIAAALLGAEPIPLLDLPLQAALGWRMALQLAMVHGRPGLDTLSREMVATVGATLSVRVLSQQVVKLAPVVGWGASAGLSALGAWLLGRGLLAYYAGALARSRVRPLAGRLTGIRPAAVLAAWTGRRSGRQGGCSDA